MEENENAKHQHEENVKNAKENARKDAEAKYELEAAYTKEMLKMAKNNQKKAAAELKKVCDLH